MLGECVTLLCSVSLQSNVTDSWRWLLDPIGGYSVRGAYQLLTSQDNAHVETAADLIWNKQVPLKVSILAWRLLRDRLPTKLNLLDHDIISADDTVCLAECGHVETTQHLILSCNYYDSLWQAVRSWHGLLGLNPQSISDHFYQFIHSSYGLPARRSFLQLVWLLCVWIIWNDCHSRLFKNIENSISQLLDKVKHHSFWWLKARNANFVYGFSRWWTNPLLYLGIG